MEKYALSTALKAIALFAFIFLLGLAACQKDKPVINLADDSHDTENFQYLFNLTPRRISDCKFSDLPTGGFVLAGEYGIKKELKIIRLAESKEVLVETNYDYFTALEVNFSFVNHSGKVLTGGAMEVYTKSRQALLLLEEPSTGAVSWLNGFGGAGVEKGYDATEASTGGYLLTGSVGDSMLVIRVDDEGQEIWTRHYGSASGISSPAPRGIKIIEAADGNFVILIEERNGILNIRYQLAKIDPDGHLIWHKTYDFPVYTGAQPYIMEASDQTVMLVTSVNRNEDPLSDEDILLAKIGAEGEVIWTRQYGGTVYNDGAEFVGEADNGDFVLIGSTGSFGHGSQDIYMIRTDLNGERLWHKTYGDQRFQVVVGATQRPDGGFWILGLSETAASADFFDYGYFILAVNGDGTPN